MNDHSNNGYNNNNFKNRKSANNEKMNFHKTPTDFNRHDNADQKRLEQVKAQQEQNRINQNSNLAKEGTKAAANSVAGPIGGQAVEAASKTELGKKVFQFAGKGMDKLKKKIILATAPSIIITLVCIFAALIAFISILIPIMRPGEAGESVASGAANFWEKLSNTFTHFCFMCSDEEVEASEKAKRDEKFYKKLSKIKVAMKAGAGMSPGPDDDPWTTYSVEIPLDLLATSLLYNEDLYLDSVEVLNDAISNDPAVEDRSSELDSMSTDDEISGWLSNNKNYLNGIGFGKSPSIESIKNMLKRTEGDLLGVGWYEARGDIIEAIHWYGIDDPALDPSPNTPCYPTEFEYSTADEPIGASRARKIAKHMIQRNLKATCRAVEDTDKEGNGLGTYHWETTQTYSYGLNIEESDMKLYNEEVHANPYPATRRRTEIVRLPHPNDYVKYMLSTYIKAEYQKQIPNEGIVGASSYITDIKIVLRNMYTYRDTWEVWLKNMEKEFNSSFSSGFGTSSCEYVFTTNDTKKKIQTSNIKVRLLECKAPYNPIQGEELVDFEKYILGVTYAENGGALVAGVKAQAVAARNFALKGAADGAKNHYFSDNQTIINISNCTGRQVYCDPDKGCWSDHKEAGDTVHSGQIAGRAYSKGPAPERLKSIVAEVEGEVLVNSNGEIIGTPYTKTDGQDQWNEMANNGKDYTEILTTWYSKNQNFGASAIKKGQCKSGFVAGDWSSWKQGSGSPWGNISMAPGETIASIGCAATSVAILIAGSGTKVNIANFNPGTFVQAMKKIGGFDKNGAIYWNKVNQIAPNFIYDRDLYFSQETWERKINIIKSYLDKGHYIVLGVNDKRDGNGPGHYVAIDKIEGSTIKTFDPGGNNLMQIIGPGKSDYPLASVTRIVLYHKTD